MSNYKVIVPGSNGRFSALGDGPYDLYVQGVFTENFEGYMSFALGDVSAKIAGIIKLSQQFLITLLTTPGSDMFEPDKGTSLANLVGGNFYDRGEVEVLVKDSVKSAGKQVLSQQTLVRPASLDEILLSVELSSLDIVNDYIRPYILLRSQAGRFSNIRLPNINVF